MYTAAEARRLDAVAINEHGIPGYALMKRAGEAAFEAIGQRFPQRSHWVVFCGAGNNGGDGYVIADLARQDGIAVTVCALKPVETLTGDALKAAEQWLASGGQVHPGVPGHIDSADLVIDALLGTGLDRPVGGEYARAIALINRSNNPVAAVDVPSGLSADTGNVLGEEAINADCTITFIGRKRGLYTGDGPDHCGEVVFAGLDVPDAVYESVAEPGLLLSGQEIHGWLPARLKNSHKGDYGWLLAVGGDRGMSGAVRLCGEAALRCGAGKVTLLSHAEHVALLNVGCPELMVRAAQADQPGNSDHEIIDSVDVLAVGPGLGRSAWSEALLDSCLQSAKPLLLDADALNIVASRGDCGRFNALSQEVVLTPHPAEAGRLLGCSTQEIQSDRVAAALELARQTAAVVVLKGCGSIIACPKGRYAICEAGNPGMASAGSGDVLSGVIGALMAQGLDGWRAACAGVGVHGVAGDRAANAIGQHGMLASDIIARLPQALCH